MTQKELKQDSLKNSTKNLFNIASKKLIFTNLFLANKPNQKQLEDSKQTSFISLSKPEKITVSKNKGDVRESADTKLSRTTSIVQLRISPRHPSNSNNNNFNNNTNECFVPTNNNINQVNNNNLYNNKKINTNNKDVMEHNYENNFNSLTTKMNKRKNTVRNNITNGTEENSQSSKLNHPNLKNIKNCTTNQLTTNKNYSTNNNTNLHKLHNSTNNHIYNKQSPNSNHFTDNTIFMQTHMLSPLTTKSFSNDIMQFLNQEEEDVTIINRSSPPRIFPISGRLSLNKTNEIVKPIAFRPQTASLLKERRGSRNNELNTNFNNPNNSYINDKNNTTRIITSNHSSTQQKSFVQPQNVQNNVYTNLHEQQIKQQSIQKKTLPLHSKIPQSSQAPMSNTCDDGYNSQNLSSSSTTSSSSSSHCLPEDHSKIISCKRPQSSRSHRKMGNNSNSRQSAHLFNKNQPESNFQSDLVFRSNKQVLKSLSGNNVIVDNINSMKNVKNYKMMMSNKDKEISWLKNQLKTGNSCFNDQNNDEFKTYNSQKSPSIYTEKDLMLKILELNKENENLNYQLETLETNLHEAYKEKDEATKLLERMKEQLVINHSENTEKLNEICSVRHEDENIKDATRNSNRMRTSCFAKSIQNNCNFNNIQSYNLDNINAYNKSTSLKLAEVIEKMEELGRKREEDKQRWQDEKHVVIEYQRKLQERLIQSSEEKWRLEKEMVGLKMELEQKRASDKVKALSVESYC